MIQIINENTRLVKVLVNHDKRMLAFPGASWATENRRESRIAERRGTVEEEIVLRCFDRDMSYEDVITALAKETAFGENGMEPISPEELRDLFYAALGDRNHPIPIVALGVLWSDPDGHQSVLCSGFDMGRRTLDLSAALRVKFGWCRGYWFGARRKSKR